MIEVISRSRSSLHMLLQIEGKYVTTSARPLLYVQDQLLLIILHCLLPWYGFQPLLTPLLVAGPAELVLVLPASVP